MLRPWDDGDGDDPKPGAPNPVRNAVAIAVLSAVGTGLVAWGIEELKKRFGSKVEKSETKAPDTTPGADKK
jgi:hypothetical protein